jgi:hypothetical protein
MVKVPVVNIIDMTFVFDRGVTAGRTVLMAVVRMWLRVFHNQESNSQKDIRSRPILVSDRRAKGLSLHRSQISKVLRAMQARWKMLDE